MDASQSRKRPRPVVSCLRCREKKLKCDRVAPCQNCIKIGCRAECTYNQHPSADIPPRTKRVQVVHEAPRNAPQQEAGRSVGVIEDLQQRMAHLEGLLGVKPPGNYGPLRDVPVQAAWPRTDFTSSYSPYLGTLVVKGTRTRYHGQNNRITLLNQFTEAKDFINQSAKDTDLSSLAKEVQFLQSKSQVSIASPESLSGVDSFPELQTILVSLPPKATCDYLIEVYIRNFENVFRIVHVPTFLQDYAFFWAGEGHETPFLSMFAPLLTAMMCVSVMFNPVPPPTEDPSSWDYLKSQLAIGNVQAWLRKLPRKHKIEFATLQTEALLFLARQLRIVSSEELWKASGSLIRSAMIMGLHVNVAGAATLSPFQAECRRRLWITIVEMDLQASTVAGMPVMTPELDFSPLTPSNLNDGDFDCNSKSLPPAKPLHELTDSLPQIILARALALRIKTMNLLQHTTPQDTVNERMEQGRRIGEYLEQIPNILKPESDPESNDPTAVLSHVIVDIFIRRPLLCLYRPVITSNMRDEPQFFEIQRACLESYTAMLSYQDLFDPHVVDLDVSNSSAYWAVFQTFFQNDIIWGALGICEYMKAMNQQSNAQSPANELSEISNSVGQHSKANLTRLVENTLDSLARRIGEKGSNMKDILLLSVVLQSVRARGPLEQKQRRMSHGAKKALSACRQHLLSASRDNQFSYSSTEQMQTPADSIIPSNLPTHPNEAPSTSSGIPDFLQQSSTLAAEFIDFETDLFAIDEGAFTWAF